MSSMELLKKKKIGVIILILTIISAILILIQPKELPKRMIDNSQKVKKVVAEIEKENEEALLIQKKNMEDKYINLVYEKKDGSHISYFVNASTGEKIEVKDIIKEGMNDAFQEKIKELIYLKYPTFIADTLITNAGNIAYEIRENDLMIYYSDFKITPSPQEPLNLRVSFNEIKDYLNFTVNLKEEYENENGFHYDKGKKTIAFTFDDGPSGSKTEKLVDILNENKAHATFFMLGNRLSLQPNTVNYVLKYGNEIGSHTYTHSNLKRLKKEELKQEEANTNQAYKNITGQNLKLLRPPYGNINDIMKETMDYVFVNWNVDTEDWRYRNVDHIYNAIINTVKDGDIVLMHDLYDTTIEAVKKALPELYVRNFQVVSVTELANLKGYQLENKKVYNSFK